MCEEPQEEEFWAPWVVTVLSVGDARPSLQDADEGLAQTRIQHSRGCCPLRHRLRPECVSQRSLPALWAVPRLGA